jgi:hypothetical protein
MIVFVVHAASAITIDETTKREKRTSSFYGRATSKHIFS